MGENPERNPIQPERQKVRAELSFGLPGHENEYVFIVDSDEYLPPEISEEIQSELGKEWEILDRGARIEIRNSIKLGSRNDHEVAAAVRKAAGEKYNLRIFI